MEHQSQEDGEALLLHRPARRLHGAAALKFGNVATSSKPHRRQNFGGTSTPRFSSSSDSGGASGYRAIVSTEPRSSSTPKTQSNSDTAQGGAGNGPTYNPLFKSRNPNRNRNAQCNFCGIEGHFERECDLRSILDRIKDYEHRLLERRHRNLNGQIHNIEDATENFEQESEDLLADQVVDACLVELNLLETPQSNTAWYLDSGATHHVSGDSNVFSELHATSGAQVRSAGGHNQSVAGVGDVHFQSSSGAIKKFPSVLYTPGITKNRLSVGSLTDQNKTLVFKSRHCFIVDNATQGIDAIATREKSRGLYRLQTGCESLCHTEPTIYTVRLQSHANLWHKRLGHFNSKGLQRMLASGAVRGLPPLRFTEKICHSCQLGKHARTKMPKLATHRSTKILELVFTDVCGPFKVNSIGGARYFVTFVDDYSRKTWVYFISQKSQVLDKFRHFVNSVASSTGLPLIALRTDNGGEYTANEFKNFCLSKGISQEFTPPHTPQRNGVAERRNRSLLDITRCLLLDKALPGHLWGEAVKAAADILNLRSTKLHPDKTPNELFSGMKPSISHLRVFGAPVFTHIPKPSRTKLEPRSERCILLSFDEQAKAYRCYRPSTKKVLFLVM